MNNLFIEETNNLPKIHIQSFDNYKGYVSSNQALLLLSLFDHYDFYHLNNNLNNVTPQTFFQLINAFCCEFHMDTSDFDVEYLEGNIDEHLPEILTLLQKTDNPVDISHVTEGTILDFFKMFADLDAITILDVTYPSEYGYVTLKNIAANTPHFIKQWCVDMVNATGKIPSIDIVDINVEAFEKWCTSTPIEQQVNQLTLCEEFGVLLNSFINPSSEFVIECL